SADDGIAAALGRIGHHYGADRVYTLALTENCQSVVVIHEWFASPKPSIRRFTSGTRLERLPLLKSCLERQEPVFINRRTPSSTGKGDRGWNYGVFPLNSETDGKTKGFLCL